MAKVKGANEGAAGMAAKAEDVGQLFDPHNFYKVGHGVWRYLAKLDAKPIETLEQLKLRFGVRPGDVILFVEGSAVDLIGVE